MEKYLGVLKKSPLFQGIENEEILPMLKCLGAQKKSCPKGSFIFYAGDKLKSVGIVLSGMVHVIQEDYWGNSNILAMIQTGGIFAEAYACVPGKETNVSVIVKSKAEILFIDVEKILRLCPNTCTFHEKLAANLLAVVANKNIMLTQKIQYLSQRTTRQKLMAFLSDEASRHGSSTFTIGFNRQQLADFLSVDRSAMSSELGRLKAEGIIDFEKETFVLK